MSAQQLARATLRPQDPVPSGIDATPVEVQFNPVQLQYEISNTLEGPGRGGRRHQIITQSSATLALELQFDSSHSGESVREQTLKIKRFARPDAVDNAAELTAVPPVVRFDWGSFTFAGLIQSYRETIDFFSADGTPLRALVSLTLTQQQRQAEEPRAAGGRRAASDPVSTIVHTLTSGPSGLIRGVAAVAEQLGTPGIARALAGQNGETSLRSSERGALLAPEQGFGAGIGKLMEQVVRQQGSDENAGISPDGRARGSGPSSMRSNVGGRSVRVDR